MKKFIIFALVGQCLSAVAVGQETVSLTLDSCISLAIKNNKTLQSAQLQAERYAHEEKAYRANFFPNFKLVANDVWSDAKGSIGGDIFGGGHSGILGSTQTKKRRQTRIYRRGVAGGHCALFGSFSGHLRL